MIGACTLLLTVSATVLTRPEPTSHLRSIDVGFHHADPVQVASVPSPSPKPSPSPSPARSPRPKPAPKPSPVQKLGPEVFSGLGAWVDLWDYELNPVAAIADMKRHGVRTLYLQTARFNSDADIAYPEKVSDWLDSAAKAGVDVVGWYLPAYSEHLQKDIRRTLAIASFRSSGGSRFDGLAVDIEYKNETSSSDEFNSGIRKHLDSVRAGVGGSYPLASIVPAPMGMALSPNSWTGFPWGHIGNRSDSVMPMGYWSYRKDCPQVEKHCPYEYTMRNVAMAADFTGKPVHAIGGVGNAVTAAEIGEFVRAVIDSKATGGSIYDYKTTPAGSWGHLGRLD